MSPLLRSVVRYSNCYCIILAMSVFASCASPNLFAEEKPLGSSSVPIKREWIEDTSAVPTLAAARDAVRKNPNSAEAWFNLGLAFDMQYDCKGAIDSYGKSIALDAGIAAPYINRASCRRRLNDMTGALQDLTEAIRLEPKNPLVLNNRGLIYIVLGEHEKAYADFSLAITVAPPSYLDPRTNRARMLCTVKRIRECIDDFSVAIKAKPEEAEYYLSRGQAYLALEERDKAKADLARAVKGLPDDPEALSLYRKAVRGD